MLGLTLVLCVAVSPAFARTWTFKGIDEPKKAEFVSMSDDYVVLTGPNGKSFEVPLASFAAPDQSFIRLLAAELAEDAGFGHPGEPIREQGGYRTEEVERLGNRLVEPEPGEVWRVTAEEDPMLGGWVHFTAPDGWVIFENLAPSQVLSDHLDRFLVNGRPAENGRNIRVIPYADGSVVVPHGPEFPALTLFENEGLGGDSRSFFCHEAYGPDELGGLTAAGSFVLKRGYMATLAEHENGTGASRNYVAQDHDVVLDELPHGLDEVRFVRVFPWRWTSKMGIAGGIHQDLDVGWFYDWNVEARSSADLEYVAIKQNRWWPGLDRDWRAKGVNHLLGFNEPDRPDQADMTVDAAIEAWPELLATGMRLGSPAPSDGGLGWLYEFMDRAGEEGLRVDFVAVHYYRAVADPGDGDAAADQLYQFLKNVHDRVERPLWVTEWNNGANWTSAPVPTPAEQEDAIEAMIEMLDETPFVERYALYNWVEEGRMLVKDDGSLTPAGEVYRDKESPVFFTQPDYE